MTQHTPMPFHWGQIELTQAVFIDGIPHITKTAVGEWLEYAEPRVAINNILTRNSYVDCYSTDINLISVDGKNRDTKVYHPIGFLLLVMESGQPKAQAMKVAVAEFVWHFAGPVNISDKERNGYIREIERLTDKLAVCRDAMVYKQTWITLQHYCRLAAWPMPELPLLGKEPQQMVLEVLP
ncbi:hypothetical protein [Spongiibacter tropicus]|uniref:hypothetical protein n=1 Tax=Spongiibacter tropicus TaxID=454602 RepID=UPI0035BE98AE